MFNNRVSRKPGAIQCNSFGYQVFYHFIWSDGAKFQSVLTKTGVNNSLNLKYGQGAPLPKLKCKPVYYVFSDTKKFLSLALEVKVKGKRNASD